MKKVIIISGPTGVGKSDLSIELAKKLNGEIISADSMQIYRKMDIGTAKIKKDEMDNINHHLIDILEPDETYSVQNFKNRAYELIEEISQKGKLPIVVGGTGLYIDALIYNYDFTEVKPNPELRRDLEEKFMKNPKDLLNKLLNINPKYSYLNLSDKKKIIRALEVYELSGKTLEFDRKNNNDKYDFLLYVLTDERPLLYDKINKRVDIMINNGLLDEVRSLLNSGINPDSQSMKAIGYRQIIDFLKGDMDLESAIEKIKQDSRHYAKRQLTWYRRNPYSRWLDKSIMSREEILNKIIEEYNEL